MTCDPLHSVTFNPDTSLIKDLAGHGGEGCAGIGIASDRAARGEASKALTSADRVLTSLSAVIIVRLSAGGFSISVLQALSKADPASLTSTSRLPPKGGIAPALSGRSAGSLAMVSGSSFVTANGSLISSTAWAETPGTFPDHATVMAIEQDSGNLGRRAVQKTFDPPAGDLHDCGLS